MKLIDSNDRAELYEIDSETTGQPISVLVYDEGFGEETLYPSDWQGAMPHTIEECALFDWVAENDLSDQKHATIIPGGVLPIYETD